MPGQSLPSNCFFSAFSLLSLCFIPAFSLPHGQGQNRTADTQIFSLLLYQLSYLAAIRNFSRANAFGQGGGRCNRRSDAPAPPLAPQPTRPYYHP